MKNNILILLCFTFFQSFSQEKMEVIRCEAVDRSSPVTNIFIDDTEQIWVGNRKGLNRVFAPDNGELVNKPASEWSLLQTHDGNADIRLPLQELIGQMGADGEAIASKEDRITAAIYDVSKGDLWVGTAQSGLFQFEIEPGLRLVKQHHFGNSKLLSDHINTLFIDRSGRLWIGTEEGACFGRYGKWRLEERYFNIKAFAENSKGEIWVMGNDLLWQVDARSRWNPIDIEETRAVEGNVADIAFDKEDDLWIASEIVAEYNTETEQARIFGPAQEFTSQDVFSITVDSKNVVWIGTNDKGLYIIQKAATLYVAADVEKYLSCNSDVNDAAVKVLVDGGDAPYSFKWSNGATNQNPNNLGAGEYALTVTDKRGKTGRAKVVIPDPNIRVSVKVDKSLSADGPADGAATVSIEGGQPPYSIVWANGETTTSATKLEAGAQTVKVTDQSGCSATGDFSLEKEVGALSLTISQTKEINCAGETTAALKVENGGGKAPFTFQWNTDGVNGDAPQNLPAGQYEVTLTDAIGQTSTAGFTIKEPDPLLTSLKVNTPASTGNADGKATVTIKGGDGNYTIKWSNGESAIQAVKLAPGNHSVTVTDGKGCSVTGEVNISENILPLSVSISQTKKIECPGTATAALQAEVAGGKPTYTFAWSGGLQGQSPTDLKTGEYTLTLTDAEGTTTTADFEIKEPKAIEISAKAEAPASTGNADGKASAKAKGGTGDLRFAWSNGASGKSAEGLAPGNYGVTVTDENGCTATASVDISENILPLTVSISAENEVKCAGEKTAILVADVSGGKAAFEYAWSGKTAEPFDAEGQKASRLGAGEYAITVTDATGATASASFKLDAPKALEISAKADAPASTGNADGKASAKANGGTGKLSFQWSNGASGTSIEALAPGEYVVTVTDENGCSANASATISENILPLSVSISQTQKIMCAGEATAALRAEPNGGKPDFSYAWSGGLQGQAPSGLKPGSYSLTVTDAEGTTAIASSQITEPQPLSVELIKNRPATTTETKNGKAILKASGGTGSFSYKWDNGETSAEVTSLGAGIHEVTVTDENGCSETVKIETKTRINPELEAGRLRTGQMVKLDKIYFQPDSTSLEPESIPTLNELFEFMDDNPGIVIEVGGHTNGIPSHEFCDNLSTERAKSVAQYLVNEGLPASRLTYKGYGKRKPIATNKTAEGRAKNQRVEIKIVRLE